MKENTVWILTYMVVVAAFAYMIGWLSGELVCRCKNAEEKMAELSFRLEHTCSGTQQQHQLKELRSVLNDVHKHIVAVSKASKSPPAKPHNINGRIHPIRPFQKVWVRKQPIPKTRERTSPSVDDTNARVLVLIPSPEGTRCHV